ncbi:MAG: SEC-C domain-containing protein, partial [Nocardioidaceae bacterium]|nr:SEC-C domain-containing protein [Nocardioidaceae bacterium]
EVRRELERRVLLSVVDRKWRERLYEMEYLREGIYLRAYSQRDPLVEYQREGFDMFAAMMEGIKEESVGFLFNLEVQVEEQVELEDEGIFEMVDAPVVLGEATPTAPEAPKVEPEHPLIKAKGLEAKAAQNLSYSAPSEGGDVEVTGSTATTKDDPFAGVGRNALCPCGSGKKYKKCHGAPGGPTGLTTRVNG